MLVLKEMIIFQEILQIILLQNLHQYLKTSTDNSDVKPSTVDRRYKATMTQKISPSVNLKINTLKPFLGDLENMPKATVNDILNLLLDNYVNTKFSTRQQEAFNSMYNTQIELLKK